MEEARNINSEDENMTKKKNTFLFSKLLMIFKSFYHHVLFYILNIRNKNILIKFSKIEISYIINQNNNILLI